MISAHHTQNINFGENGYIEATRYDTAEIQDFHLKAFLPDSQNIRELRVVYNIQYDYYRKREWKSGLLIYDFLNSFEGYGHLQWEFSQYPPERWSEENPYPNNYEPIKIDGCDMFHKQGYAFGAYLLENKITAKMNCYIYNDLDDERKQYKSLITDAHVVTCWNEIDYFDECTKEEIEELKNNPFNPDQARKERLEFLERYSKIIGISIPLDSRFID